jgi:hypothetical protein
VLTVTSQDYIVHWLGSISEDGNTRLVDATIILPYLEGDSIRDAEVSTEILNNYDNTKAGTNGGAIHTQEVFMVCHSRSPLIPPEQPDVRSESNISPDAQGDDSEAESQRQVRERKNRLKQGHRCQAKQRKEAWARYDSNQPSTKRGDQRDKLKICVQPEKHTTLHMPRFES